MLLTLALFCSGTVLHADVAKTKLSIHVVTPGGKPLDRASVIIRFVSGREKMKLYSKIRTQWETKTNQEGMVQIPTIPQGKIQIQVIASGYQTFGQIFDVDEAEKTLEIKMNAPQAQYSAH
ncbi:MAG: carboxypeptidase-like regulatory domain-containing protein [Acidobacteriota bacterium]|nr:carboxypeptidase-like regulatory domain-containing protein [Acidobacteriota bacterium]